MTDNLNSLYTNWLNALPEAFRAMVPASGLGAAAANDATVDSAAMPFPADQIGKALGGLDGMLTQLYQGYLPLLAKGGLTAEPLQAMANAATEAFNGLLAALPNPSASMPTSLTSMPGYAELTQALQPWTGLVQGLMPGAAGGQGALAAMPGANQLQLGIKRTFGGLGEAFGLGPMRDFEQALREMVVASAAKQRAQIEYLALVAQAFSKGTQALVKELQAMGARGERVESLLAFVRLLAKSVDGPMHQTMQEAKGLEITAKVIRASSQHRQQLQKTIAIASEAMYIPTRADMDEAFREIQELKREVRRLKKPPPPAGPARTVKTTKPARAKAVHAKE